MSRRATVAAVHGRRILADLDDDGLHPVLLASRRLRPVCGDRVRLSNGDEPAAVAIEPRAGELWRHDPRRGRRLLAANVDRVAVVTAPQPRVSPEQIDRYLAIAALLGLPALLVRNKSDVADAGLDEALRAFARLGYPLVHAAADDTAALAPALQEHTAVFVGLSGVGKSSLVNALIPDHAARTAALSPGSGEGRHTTTATRLYRLPDGGAVIDSPGVRDIRLWPMPGPELLAGYVDLAPHAADCRFRDCRHADDPGCAVRAAAESGTVAVRRYRSYRDLAERLEKERPASGAIGPA